MRAREGTGKVREEKRLNKKCCGKKDSVRRMGYEWQMAVK